MKQNKTWAKNVLIDQIWSALGCTEQQTKKIIEQFLDDIKLFDKKQRDYGTNNISKFGVFGVLVRASDKLERLTHLYSKSKKSKMSKIEANEPIEDSWADLSVYSAIARIVNKGEWSKER